VFISVPVFALSGHFTLICRVSQLWLLAAFVHLLPSGIQWVFACSPLPSRSGVRWGSAAPVPGFTLPRWLLPRRLGKAGTPPIARQLSFETEVPSCFVVKLQVWKSCCV
jgi:hypothetical protein